MTMKDSVIRPLKNAVDDLPVHVKQLAEMFRKHGGKQDSNVSGVRDIDSSMVPPSLQNGWRESSWFTPDRIVGSGKPNRPHPSEYLDAGYMSNHLAKFEGGASRFYPMESLTRHGPGNGGTTFVFPTSELDDMIAKADGDPKELAAMLGLAEDYFDAGDIVRADFTPDEIINGDLRLPRGSEAGANPQWIPGGLLPTGVPEAVFNVSDMNSVGNYTEFDIG